MTILCVVGARPNVIKLAPVISALRASLPNERCVLVDTGQHYDPDLSLTLREQLNVPEPDHQLGVGSASHAVQTARVMERIEPILEEERPDLVVVPGDVNSTLAVVLVAAKLEIPIAHIEAGLRSYDRSMPEEINRVLIDQLSEICFIHSRDAEDNLSREGVARSAIHFVGNTMIDSLLAMQEQFRALDTARKLGLEPGGYLLVTLHRPALVDGPLLRGVLSRLELLAGQLPVVFPVHPRTRRFLPDLQPSARLRLLEPVGYLEFMSLQADAAAVLTDSGGIQEESTFLGVPCFTLRDNTERPVTVTAGTNRLLGLDPLGIDRILPALATGIRRDLPPPPGWDGHAAQRIAGVVSRWLDSRVTRQGAS